jgi:hypothetical protein
MSRPNLVDTFKDLHLPVIVDLLREGCRDRSEILFLESYRGRPWSDLDADVLETNWECIFFLNKIGFKFVLVKFIEISSRPTYMKSDWIDSVKKLASNLLDSNDFSYSERKVIEEFIISN